MRIRQCITLLCVSFGFIVVAQNVPNGGFENWAIEDHFRLNDWVSYGFPKRTNDATSGNYAVNLENYANNQGKYYGSSLYNVDWQNGSVDKFPYDGDPLSMVFDTKHELGLGDTADLIAGFYEKGNWIGDAKIQLDGSTNGQFVTYSVPIVWYSTSRTPDSVFIGMRSSIHPEAKGPGYVIIDDYRFENIGYRTKEITNYSFENWSNVGVEYPEDFMSLDLLAYREWGGFLLNPSVSADSNAFRGNTCLKVSNFDDWNNQIGEGAIFTGDTFTDAWRPAFSVDQKYTYLQGYYKYIKGGSDEATIDLNMFIAGNAFADGAFVITENQPSWTFFSIPINYYVDLVPDSATIRIVSAESNKGTSSETTLYLDELAFVNELDNRVSIQDINESLYKVYPNPCRNALTLESDGGEFELLDIQGKTQLTGILQSGTSKINTQSISQGIYTLIITDNRNRKWQKRIIKQ